MSGLAFPQHKKNRFREMLAGVGGGGGGLGLRAGLSPGLRGIQGMPWDGFWWVLVGSVGFGEEFWWVPVCSGGFWCVLVGSGVFWWVLVGSGWLLGFA